MLGQLAGNARLRGSTRFAAGPGALAKVGALLVLIAVLAVTAWIVGQMIALGPASANVVTTSLDDRGAVLHPGEQIHLALAEERADLVDVRLSRNEAIEPGGRRDVTVPVHAQALGADGWRLVSPDGGGVLAPDGEYRMVVRASVLRPALPWPKLELVQYDRQFATAPSPRVSVPADPVTPRWGEPVPVQWSAPIQRIEVETSPAAPTTAWVDRTDPTRTWIQLGGEGGAGLVGGQRYDVSIVGARAIDGIALQRPASFEIAVPEQPSIVDARGETRVLKLGETIQLTASTELASLGVRASDSTPLSVKHAGRTIELGLPDYRQGATFAVEVFEATTPLGAPLERPARFTVTTPPPMAAPEIAPNDGATQVRVAARPWLTFAEPIAEADRPAIERALSIEPAVPGKWEWVEAAEVRFVAEARLPSKTELTIRLRGGPEGPRSASGGYLESDFVSQFTTAQYKQIDVDLGRQLLHMVEDDRVIRTIPVATGVRGAETPPGDYQVQYKMRQAHFRGVNPSGLEYDIQDVNWVLAFLGDYTIHGAHWRRGFGAPASNGCVSMSDPEAKVLYDWSENGTPIRIR